VRCIQRLDETCKDMRNAARVIGDSVLYSRMSVILTSVVQKHQLDIVGKKASLFKQLVRMYPIIRVAGMSNYWTSCRILQDYSWSNGLCEQ